jgi:hypothetical protein
MRVQPHARDVIRHLIDALLGAIMVPMIALSAVANGHGSAPAANVFPVVRTVAWPAATGTKPPLASAFRRDEAANMWLSDNGGYVWELSKTATVVGVLTDCKGPEGIKVDHRKNLWAACIGSRTIQEYTPGATSASLILNDTSGFFPNDVAVDEHGNVFATNLDGFKCVKSSCTTYPGDVVFWTRHDLQSGATPSGTLNDPNIYEAFFLDTDADGNVFVDMLNYGSQNGETDEIVNPLGASLEILNTGVNPGYPGGVYVNNASQILNVLDQNTYTIARYQLPSGPFLPSLGPMPQNYQGTCNPVSMGFSRGDVRVAVADVACSALDKGAIASNTFTQLFNASFKAPVSAAFVASDK